MGPGRADKGLVFDTKPKADEWLDSWLSGCQKPLVDAGKMAHSTYVRYEGIVGKHLKPALGHRKLSDLTRPEVRRLYAEKGKALLRAVQGHRNEALFVAAIHTGLRQGELLGLKWTDADLDARSPRVSVRRALKVTESGLDFGSTKNKASRRSVPLNGTAVAALRAHRARQNEERLANPEWRNADLVFPNRLGGPMDHNNLYYRDYKPLLKRAGLEDRGFTFHALRHTFATALFERGQHPKIVQSLCGHSSITQTMDTYSHLMEGMDGDAVGGLDEAFGG